MIISQTLNKHQQSSETNKAIDDAVFEELYKSYWPKLYAIAYNRLNSRQGAEDVVQEVMLGLWQRKKETSIDNLEAWLAMATRYAVFRQMAKSARQITSPISLHSDKAYHQDFDSSFIKEILQQHIQQLPEKCKLVFDYSRNYELSNKEIAGKLDISEKAVEKHITKAIHKLRTKLDKVLRSVILLFSFFFL